jgi:hypothetical protein
MWNFAPPYKLKQLVDLVAQRSYLQRRPKALYFILDLEVFRMAQGRRTQLGKDYFIMLKIGSLVSAMLSLFAFVPTSMVYAQKASVPTASEFAP